MPPIETIFRLGADPVVMGILNVTPDSFTDGGKYLGLSDALARAEQMISEGASIIDIGGESTRPGAKAVSVSEELGRVVPLVRQLRKITDVPISVDTSTPEVITQSAAVGASMINDVRALARPGALAAVVLADLPVCLMHMQGAPETMQENPIYIDVIDEVKSFLSARIDVCLNAGMKAERIILDPGFGFGKTVQHNLTLIKRLAEFSALNKPLLVGLSRKSTIGAIAGNQLVVASVAAAMIAVDNGASIVRVHDVADTVAALAVREAIQTEGKRW